MKIHVKEYKLIFKKPSGTSRGILTTKDSIVILAQDGESIKYGEVSFIPGLNLRSYDDSIFKLKQIAEKVNSNSMKLEDIKTPEFPAIQFGLDCITYQKNNSDFNRGVDGIPINGLIWMGNLDFMKSQINEKLKKGYKVIKLKIGNMNWDDEHALLKNLRKQFTPNDLEIRVDANGAYSPKQAIPILHSLHKLGVHSIEQPIMKGNWDEMHKLCSQSDLPIALDEELIGVTTLKQKRKLIEAIMPQYLILKPSLLGGFMACQEWIDLCEEYGVEYWVTSALESNIGLNAIAHWTYSLQNDMPQGLGTGGLYTNNIKSPLFLKKDRLFYNPNAHWDYSNLTKTTH